MVKIIKLDPIAEEIAVETRSNILSALLSKDLDVLKECGGRGMCATCHVYIKEGMEGLSDMNRHEKRTLEVITTAKANSRLACQAQIMGEGVVVELPAGMYINAIENVEALIGRRAQQDLLHPITGQVVVESGKLITRSIVTQLNETRFQVGQYLVRTKEA